MSSTKKITTLCEMFAEETSLRFGGLTTDLRVTETGIVCDVLGWNHPGIIQTIPVPRGLWDRHWRYRQRKKRSNP